MALIPTEVKGRKLAEDELSLGDFQFAQGRVTTCPAGRPPVKELHNEAKERWVVRFPRERCRGCPVAERQKFYSLSFSDRQAVVAQRRQQLEQEVYREKCRLRPAVEGTVSQFKQKMHNGKLRVRGDGRVRNAIIAMAIGVNFGRIWAYLAEKKAELASSLALAVGLFVTFAVIIPQKWARKHLIAQRLAPGLVW